MAEAYYEPTPATDGATMNPVPGAPFQVFEIADTTFSTPLSLRVGSGNPTTTIKASDTLATLPGVYVTSPNFEHIWKSGTFEWRRDSIDGAKKAVDEAKVAASNSAAAADASADSAASSAVSARDAANLVNAPADTAVGTLFNQPASQTRTAADGLYLLKVGGLVASKVVTGSTDQAAVLQAEIDALSAAGGGTILLPGGTITVSTLVMKDGVSLEGAGKYVTILKALAGGTATSLITLAAGPVRGWLRHLSVLGNSVAGQRGIYFQAVGNGGVPNHGGWWNSGLDNVRVQYFLGDQIWLRGGGVDYLKPHQFLTFKDVECYTTGTAAALRLTGQVAQMDFVGHCEFDGPGQTNDGTNIVITREVNDDMTNKSDIAPAVIDFGITTTQNNKRGITVERAQAVSFSGWVENVSEAINTSLSAIVNVSKAYFTSTGVNAGVGFVLRAGSGCTVIAERNVFGTSDKHLVNSFGTVLQSENITTTGAAVITEGMTPNVGITAAGAVDLGGARSALVNGSATQLITINSNAGTGERLSLKAWAGSIIINSTGNINASGLTMPYTVPSNGVVTLVKYDLGAVWNIESVSTQ